MWDHPRQESVSIFVRIPNLPVQDEGEAGDPPPYTAHPPSSSGQVLSVEGSTHLFPGTRFARCRHLASDKKVFAVAFKDA